jgi:BirA family biotin operon repressor/biotin-[acetyl-CoA-carboxylase] ligase
LEVLELFNIEAGPFWNISVFDEVESTNILIKQVIAGGESESREGCCFVARKQTRGYGRQGRQWSSPDGGLYFSFLLDPFMQGRKAQQTLATLPTLSLVLSLGMMRALKDALNNENIRIKWPNDVILTSGQTYSKLCGISLELSAGKVCCGIGVNVLRPKAATTESALPSVQQASVKQANNQQLNAQHKDLQQTDARQASAQQASASQLPIKTASYQPAYLGLVEVLLPNILHHLQDVYLVWLKRGIEAFIDPYNEALFNIGSSVTLETIDGKIMVEGEVLGISQTGQLLVKTPQGTVVAANSGEVHTR